MAALNGPNLGINYGWALGENGWKDGMDANLKMMDAIVQLAVLGVANSPTVTTNGTRYIVGTAPTGAFAGHANAVAVRVAGNWDFYAPANGWIAQVPSAGTEYTFNSGAWKERFGATAFLNLSDPGGFTFSSTSYTKIPLYSVDTDNRSGWSIADNDYTIQESGLYLITAIVRPKRTGTGAIPDSVTFGLGIGDTAADSENVAYGSGPVGGGLFTVSVSRTARFAAGAKLYLFGKHYHSAAVALDFARLSVAKLSA